MTNNFYVNTSYKYDIQCVSICFNNHSLGNYTFISYDNNSLCVLNTNCSAFFTDDSSSAQKCVHNCSQSLYGKIFWNFFPPYDGRTEEGVECMAYCDGQTNIYANNNLCNESCTDRYYKNITISASVEQRICIPASQCTSDKVMWYDYNN